MQSLTRGWWDIGAGSSLLVFAVCFLQDNAKESARCVWFDDAPHRKCVIHVNVKCDVNKALAFLLASWWKLLSSRLRPGVSRYVLRVALQNCTVFSLRTAEGD